MLEALSVLLALVGTHGVVNPDSCAILEFGLETFDLAPKFSYTRPPSIQISLKPCNFDLETLGLALFLWLREHYLWLPSHIQPSIRLDMPRNLEGWGSRGSVTNRDFA